MIRATFRAILLILHLMTGLLLAAAIGLDFTKRLEPERLARWWSRRVLAILNVEVNVQGAGVTGPRVIVANHISWLDIPVISSLENTRFVAKSEIRHWPIAGWFALAAGSFFIRRGKGGSKPLLAKAVPHLKDGGSFVFFPEGTTTAGEVVLKFHPRLFEAAVEAECPVQPIALCYEPTEAGEAIAPFVGDDDLVSHILRVLQTRKLRVEMHYCPAIDARGQQREAIASAAHASIRRIVAPYGAVSVPAEDEATEATLLAA
jgi:1-acyl-sn-glycerol-3-phosphate acyltransferase